jgi:hypothetical protein
MAPLTESIDKRVVGVGLSLAGLEFLLLFDPVGVNVANPAKDGWVHRPTELHVKLRARAHAIGLTWVPGTPDRSIRIVQRGI